MASLHISLPAEEVFTIFSGVPVTNSVLTAWIVMGILIIVSVAVRLRVSLIPNNVQAIFEILLEGLYNLFQTIVHEKIRIIFPLLASLFIYILLNNWIGLLPGVGTIGLTHIVDQHKVFVPLFRAATADLNLTLSLALVAMGVIQLFGFKELGTSYLSRFFNFGNPVHFFVGILELVSEISKVISFAFRLFGNIFAGEVLLTVIAFLIPILAPIPFIGLELFVGFIQALVFSMLTAVFLSVATSHAAH